VLQDAPVYTREHYRFSAIIVLSNLDN